MLLRYVTLLTLFVLCACANKVKLKDLTSLTLHHGQYTTARRSSAVPQLKCVGGSAKGRYEPKIVQCYNRGFDGNDVQWECKAELRKEVEFGKIRVSCEGYDYPDDPYVLAGSCGLESELEYVDDSYSHHHGSQDAKHKKQESAFEFLSFETLLIVGVVCFMLYLMYTSATTSREGHEGDRSRGGPGGFPPFPGSGPDGQPPPPGFKTSFDAPPPSYDEATRRSGRFTTAGESQQSSSSNGPGFFTGLGLGGLAGYAFGRSRDDNSQFRRRGPTAFEDHTGYFSAGPSTSRGHRGSSPTSSESETRTSSGFGGTVRR